MEVEEIYITKKIKHNIKTNYVYVAHILTKNHDLSSKKF